MEGFTVGFAIGLILYIVNMRMYKKILIEKAKAPLSGQCNVEFIFGKPYVIMSEADYCKNCKVWYE